MIFGSSAFTLFHVALSAWRRTYVIGAVISLYLNCFVLVVQAFLKVPALNALAPQGKEPPFAIAQSIVLVLAVVSGYLAVRRFRPVSAQAALAPG